MQKEQYVCTACGFNMIGYYPENCPFCGAPREKFLTSEECSTKFKVKGTPVKEKVTRLNSVPALGLEHAAYRIERGTRAFWIDCPSSFDKSLKPADVITFTHHHFLGASNQYRRLFPSEVRIHRLDSTHGICQAFTFDKAFEQDFTDHGIEAFHIGGHTPGFTLYLWEDVLFICDYVFLRGDEMTFNPFGPGRETREGGKKIGHIIEGRKITKVCGYNYVADYLAWKEDFEELLKIG